MDQSELAPDCTPKQSHPVVHFSVFNETDDDKNDAETKQTDAETDGNASPPLPANTDNNDNEPFTTDSAVTAQTDAAEPATADVDANPTANVTSESKVDAAVPDTEGKAPLAKVKTPKKNNTASSTAKNGTRRGQGYTAVEVYDSVNAAGYDRLLRVNAVKDYLGWSVFALICCCFPLNVVGLMHTIMTREAKRYGDVNRAEKKSLKAKNWLMASTAFGATIIGTWLVLQFYWYR